jgi:hypothetical protein
MAAKRIVHIIGFPKESEKFLALGCFPEREAPLAPLFPLCFVSSAPAQGHVPIQRGW